MGSQEKREKEIEKAEIDALILRLQQRSYKLGKELEGVSTSPTLANERQSVVMSRRSRMYKSH
jgi:hypothetical protein